MPPQVGSPPNRLLSTVPFFSRMESHHYFRHNQTGHLGPASLVSLAYFKNRFCAHEIPPQHVYNQVLIAQHASYLTKGQKKNFARLLHNLTIAGSVHNTQIQRNIPPIPLTFSDLRSKCTEGPNSIAMNLPYPAIQTDVRSHCYVRISDVIEDFLAHGFLPLQPEIRQSEDWVTNLSHAPQLVSSLQQSMTLHGQKPFYFVAFKEWQDDYESLNARTDRGSVWCKNITILAEPGTPRHLCTYPIAFGTKSSHHHSVETKIEEDMMRFKTNSDNFFYSSKLGKQIRVHACLYVSIADQLERRPVTCTTGGNHNYHARFGYSIRYKSLLHCLPSCPQCRVIIKAQLASAYDGYYISQPRLEHNIPVCEVCLSWLHDLEKHPNISTPPPDNFPTCQLDELGGIKPFRLTFEKLVAAGTKATENILLGNWTIQEAESYLDVYCMAGHTREDIIQRASLHRQINSSAEGVTDASLQEKIVEMLLLDPTVLDPWIPPAIWTRSFSLAQHLDAPMHLIFHGILKGICRLIAAWLTNRRSETSFGRYYSGLLEPICDMCLDWCKLTPFSGSFAGWLAETYVGMSKILLWFWSGLLRVSQDPEYEPPATPYQCWTGDMCKKWLRARRISIKTMSAPEAKAMVADLMMQPGGPPPVPPPTGGPLETVIDMLGCLDRLIRVLMSHAFPVGGKDVVTLHVIDFLNAFDSFKPLNEDRKFPEWLTMYNFLCLLNLPEAIERLGPLRFNYEGSTEGEGFIPMVKPLLSQGMRKNWQKNLAHRFFKNRSMKMVVRDAQEFIGQPGHDFESGYKKKMFQKYKRWEQVLEHFTKGLPISLVVLRNGFLGAVVNDRELWKIVPFCLMDFTSEYAGLNYFRVQLFERDAQGRVIRNIINYGRHAAILHYVLLLPLLGEFKYTESNEDMTWTMVGSEYERLGSDGTLQSVYDLPINLFQMPEEMEVTQDNLVGNDSLPQDGQDWAVANDDEWDEIGVI
jgi:hypothetical protein